MKLLLLRYGFYPIEIHINHIDRIISKGDLLELYYLDGSHITGYMLKVQQ